MSDTEFLKPAELHDLTGFARAAEQDAWMTERGIPHKRDGKRVIVMRAHIEARAAQARKNDLTRYILTPAADTLPAGTYPARGECKGVYMLFAEDGALNYVGKSAGVGYRVVQHVWAARRGKRKPFTEYACVEVPGHILDGLEVAYIHALQPPENCLPRIQWNRHDEAVRLIKAVWGEKK